MAFERIKEFFRDRRGGQTWSTGQEANMSEEERTYAEEPIEDQAADRAAAEHLGGVDPTWSENRDEL